MEHKTILHIFRQRRRKDRTFCRKANVVSPCSGIADFTCRLGNCIS